MKKKQLLYIGHKYHHKTKSTAFLKDLFKTKYDLTVFDFDMDQDDYQVFENLKGAVYDLVVLFQLPLDLKRLKKFIHTKGFVFFPMYDGVEGADFNFWYQYQDAKIINFSKTLHEKLLSFGLDSHYIQYFSKPIEKPLFKDGQNVYFWQRVTDINLPLIEKLFQNIPVQKLHIHKALDPNHQFKNATNKLNATFEYSEWYDDKDDMIRDMQEAGIYIAPRITEGIGMSFLEAMAMGKCVVANNKPTMNEYITDGETGILYDLNHIEPLKAFNAYEIGQKAYAFIQKGYQQWEKEKSNILVWMDEPVCIDKKKLERHLSTITYRLFFCIEFLKITKSIESINVTFLKWIPLLTIRRKEAI